MHYPILKLNPGRERRIQAGHLWIFSNEIDNAATPLKSFQAGHIVQVVSARDQALGLATLNPQCLLCARILTRDVKENIDVDFFVKRIKSALALRERFYSQPFYRLIYSEGDYLSGLIVDRYDQTLVVQMNTAGMQAQNENIIEALKRVLNPARIILRNDSSYRLVEGLPQENSIVFGDNQAIFIEENGTQFLAPALDGQKTAWFYDHRANRAELMKWVQGKRVLDVYSYLGGWGLEAAKHGAKEVFCIDRSKIALEFLEKNAELNKLKVKTTLGDAFKILQDLADAQEKFDIVIVDPPAFIKSKKDINQGIKGYEKLNRLAMTLISPGGLFVSASCSLHLSREDLLTVLQTAAQQNQRSAQVVYQGGQAYDHPVHPAILETSYLKAFFVRLD